MTGIQTETAGVASPWRPTSTDVDGDSMLIEVDFKWLMAGQGCWIDPARLHNDPGYARWCLHTAQRCDCAALRQCARQLQHLLDT